MQMMDKGVEHASCAGNWSIAVEGAASVFFRSISPLVFASTVSAFNTCPAFYHIHPHLTSSKVQYVPL